MSYDDIERQILGDDNIPGVFVVPKAGANYDDDPKTVTAVQYTLLHNYGYDLGTSGPNNDGVDGLYGSYTKNAVKKLQKSLSYDQTGIIDENIVRVLKITPGKLPPGVTAQANAAVNAQAQLEIATAAEHAKTSSDVQAVAQQAQIAADNTLPPLPSDVKKKVDDAVVKAKAAKTPTEAQAAGVTLADALKDAHEAVKPSWWVLPMWPGAPVKRWQGVVGGSVTIALATVLIATIARRKK